MKPTRQWMVALTIIAMFAAIPAHGELLTRTETPIEPSRQPEPARTKGWTKSRPKGLIALDSGKRNPVFYVGEPVVFTLGGPAATYEVRDYHGQLIDSGTAGGRITIKATDPGWYKLYVFGNETTEEFGNVVGGTTFIILRHTPGFPEMPPKGTPFGSYPSEDQPMRGVLGIGPQRHSADANKAEESIKKLTDDFALDQEFYLPFDPARDRREMVAFPNGTKNEAGVRQIVEAFKDIVTYWEPRNEPNFGASGAGFLEKELKAFHRIVKEADPDGKVMGPGTVSIGPNSHGLYWIDDFLRAGGGQYIDAFSFHAYNALNGDIFMARRTMDDLQAVLEKHGLGKMEKWQTEQGYFAALYGAYQPRLQGRWTMLEMMVFDQYDLPKERNHLWYDRSHGFWDFPTWWENGDGSINPIGAMMRTFSEEQYGAPFLRALDFGKDGNKLFIGNVYRGKDRTTVAIMNTGAGTRALQVSIPGVSSVRLTSAFGVETQVPVVDGIATIDVPEVPVYLRLGPDQDIRIIPINWGANLARRPGVSVRQVDQNNATVPTSDTDKIHNGYFENWYQYQKPNTRSWKSSGQFPVIVEMQLADPADISRVAIFSHIPWQSNSTLVDYELQYQRGDQWTTIDRVIQPTKVIGVFTPPTRSTVDSFFSDQWIFEHRFETVNTKAIRLVVHQATFGGGPTQKLVEAGGQTGAQLVTLREIEVYGAEPTATVQLAIAQPNQYSRFERLPVQLTLNNASATAQTLVAMPVLPAGWSARPEQVQVQLDAGGRRQAEFEVIAPAQLPGGDTPIGVALRDTQGRTVDQDQTMLRIHAPIQLTPSPIRELNPSAQALEARLANATTQPVDVQLTIVAQPLRSDGAAHQAQERVSLEASGNLTVPITLPGINLAQGAWRISYMAQAANMTVSAEQILSIRPWMGAGPFAKDFDQSFGPEEKVDPAATYPVMGTDQPKGWKPIPNEASGLVNLARHFKPNSNVSAYAAITVRSPEARQAIVSAGSDDGLKVWINGQRVISHDIARGAVPGDDRANVNLRAGDNLVLVRVTQGGGGWGFYLDLLGLDGLPIQDLQWKAIE